MLTEVDLLNVLDAALNQNVHELRSSILAEDWDIWIGGEHYINSSMGSTHTLPKTMRNVITLLDRAIAGKIPIIDALNQAHKTIRIKVENDGHNQRYENYGERIKQIEILAFDKMKLMIDREIENVARRNSDIQDNSNSTYKKTLQQMHQNIVNHKSTIIQELSLPVFNIDVLTTGAPKLVLQRHNDLKKRISNLLRKAWRSEKNCNLRQQKI